MHAKTDPAHMRILLLGDVVGRPGRHALRDHLAQLRTDHTCDVVIANAENCAGGKGITRETVDELFAAGIDALTTGDHVFQQKSAEKALVHPRVVRPANYPAGAPGHRWISIQCADCPPIAITNVLGRVFMKPLDCPFRTLDAVVEDMRAHANILLVDMHAEATSEKIALGRYCDGRVSVLYGTHTHVQTADECILPNGTAYITDLGMCGAHDSILGRDISPVIDHFISCRPQRFTLAQSDVRIMGAICDIDTTTGHAAQIRRICYTLPANEN